MKQATTLRGIPVSAGIAIGPVFLYNYDLQQLQEYRIAYMDIEKEVDRFKHAIDKARQQLLELKEMVSQKKNSEKNAAIFDTHILVLEDPMVFDETIKLIRSEHKNAEYLFFTVIEKLAHALKNSNDEHFQARGIDLYDLGNRVIKNLRESYTHLIETLKEEVIVVSYDLGPSDTAHMINGKVIAFATERGGPTSHTAIMAKALEIPAVVGIDKISQLCCNGDTIIVDGSAGVVITHPSPEQIEEYREKIRILKEREKTLIQLQDLPAETVDHHRINLEANIELPQEVHHTALHGADGIGLYRTEFIYLDKDKLPTEDEQFEVYKDAVLTVAPKPVIFRTIDLGGDKFASFIPVPEELNPFLGMRAIRLCLEFPDIFRTQLRALYRASALGNVKIMFPMIADRTELTKIKEIVASVQDELRCENIPFNPECPLGIMIEVPAAVMSADILAQDVAFFSIGTNDLIQYSFAIDRINEKVAHLYQPLHPAILRMIKMTIDAGHRSGIWVGVCGEIAADPLLAVILMGMGIDKLSMASKNIAEVKRTIRSITFREAEKLATAVLEKNTVEEVKTIVSSHLCSIEY